MQLGASVNSMVKGSKERITLECKKIKDTVLLTDDLKNNLGEHYKVYTAEKKLPKLKIVGIEDNVYRDKEIEFIQEISRQNELNTDNGTFKINIIKKIKTQNDDITMILDVGQYTR